MAANCQWVLESYGDADWSANKAHRRSTSCGMHFLNNAFVYGSSRSQKTISLSSCESEPHSLVSCMCDGLFIVACAEFVLGEKLEHVQYTDSSSARQLASRQGVGKVRHLSGKILWVQEKVNEGTVNLRQVPTIWNVADIGTKCLNQQRMMVLMHETGLVYIPTGEPVGTEEHQRQSEKTGNQRQLQKITKAILRMSILMGLEPVGVAGVEVCPADDPRTTSTFWIWSVIFAMIFIACLVMRYAWKKWKYFQWELNSAQQQLADHYDYAATLCARIDNLGWIDAQYGEYLDESVTSLTARIAVHEEDTQEHMSMPEDLVECVRYGLMEFGGFVRNEVLTASQRSHMFTQERANFVIWTLQRN